VTDRVVWDLGNAGYRRGRARRLPHRPDRLRADRQEPPALCRLAVAGAVCGRCVPRSPSGAHPHCQGRASEISLAPSSWTYGRVPHVPRSAAPARSGCVARPARASLGGAARPWQPGFCPGPGAPPCRSFVGRGACPSDAHRRTTRTSHSRGHLHRRYEAPTVAGAPSGARLRGGSRARRGRPPSQPRARGGSAGGAGSRPLSRPRTHRP
jgi:hypothetical protein